MRPDQRMGKLTRLAGRAREAFIRHVLTPRAVRQRECRRRAPSCLFTSQRRLLRRSKSFRTMVELGPLPTKLPLLLGQCLALLVLAPREIEPVRAAVEATEDARVTLIHQRRRHPIVAIGVHVVPPDVAQWMCRVWLSIVETTARDAVPIEHMDENTGALKPMVRRRGVPTLVELFRDEPVWRPRWRWRRRRRRRRA